MNTPFTLAIDIGGSGIKMLVLDHNGKPVTERSRCETPRPAIPQAIIHAIAEEIEHHKPFNRISVGFPGVVVDGITLSAVNLHEDWHDVDLQQQLTDIASVPVRVANDADIQGYGAIDGHGVELVITLGTGFGSALFNDGELVPNLELGHHRFEQGQTYEELLGQAARKRDGKDVWRDRFLRAIKELDELFNPSKIYVGGGNAKKLKIELPEKVVVTDNIAGILGGIKLWH